MDPTDLVERRLGADPLIGMVLHGYRLEAAIGQGSAARVYRARHLFLDRSYAVKVLSAASGNTIGLASRFEREARALSEMSHPNIVSVVDFGTTPGGRPFLTMELLGGRTLAEVMERERPMARGRIRLIARQLAEGLAEAHRHRIVHRDLKPANVMLVEDRGCEVVKILDFGIARASDRPTSVLTGQDVVLGTPRYMAPEQVMNPTSVSPASDFYSLGVIIYEMLAGHAPFDGEMMEVLDQQMNREPPPLTTNTGLEELVHRLLSKRPEDRPYDACEVMRALDRPQGGRSAERRSTVGFEDETNALFVEGPVDTVLDDATISEARYARDFDDPTEIDPSAIDQTAIDRTAVDRTEIDRSGFAPTELSRSVSDRTEIDLAEMDRTEIDRGMVAARPSATAEIPAATLLFCQVPKQTSHQPKWSPNRTPTPTPTPRSRRPRVARRSRHDRIAAILACIALVLGCSVVALAAVSVQRRLQPEVVVVAPR